MESFKVKRTLVKEVQFEETVLPHSGEVSYITIKEEICDEEPIDNKKENSLACSEEEINPAFGLNELSCDGGRRTNADRCSEAKKSNSSARNNPSEMDDQGFKVEDSFEIVEEDPETEALYETEEDAVNIDEVSIPRDAFDEEEEDPLKIDDNAAEIETFCRDRGNASKGDKAKPENFPVALVVNVNALKEIGSAKVVSQPIHSSQPKMSLGFGHGSCQTEENRNIIKIGKDILLRCEICQDMFRGKVGHNQHLRMHLREPFPCVVCKEIYYSRYELESHMSKEHEGVNKIYQCPMCPRKYAFYSSMKQHHGLHALEKKYKCNRCQKRFHFISHLNKHLKIHAKIAAVNKARQSEVSTDAPESLRH